ncbi:MAG: cation diffusion facilitator family transporter [Oceanococcus sp.]
MSALNAKDQLLNQKATGDRLRHRAAVAAIVVALLLIAIKLAAYVATGSVALLSSLVDSSLDALVSGINFLAIRHAMEPPDEDHRFGHGKAEALAGVAQAAFITGSALFLMVEAGRHLIRPEPLQFGALGIAVMLISIVLTLALVLYQRSVARRTGSLAISADSVHYSADLVANVGVIVALFLSTSMGWIWVDAVIALAIGGWILRSAGQVGRGAWDQLMDRELPDADVQKISEIATATEGVRGIHELRTRASGDFIFVQMHVDIDGSLALRSAHEIAERVEQRLLEAYPKADITLHEDPV